MQPYQFEAIHPLSDGNGRTGRVPNQLFLIDHGPLDLPVLYLSGAIIRRKQDCYRWLRRVTTDGACGPWLLLMIEAVRETAPWTTAKVRAIRDLLDETVERIRRDAPRIYSRELAETIFVQLCCRIGNLDDAGIARRQSASVYLKTLAGIGVPEKVTL